MTAAERVALGAALLDRAVGETWVDRVWAPAVDVRSSQDCILGQVFGSYGAALEELDLRVGEAAEHGFSAMLPVPRGAPATPSRFEDDVAELNQAWRDELSRRGAA